MVRAYSKWEEESHSLLECGAMISTPQGEYFGIHVYIRTLYAG